MKLPKLDLTQTEKATLKKAGVKIADICNYTPDEICELLSVTESRAIELSALIAFQSIPSVGPKFARDLIDMGYYSLAQLKNRNGADLLNDHERLIGAWTDPCVEDQFRLVVYYAGNPGSKKQWWDFTAERKAFRKANGYPATRPQKSWQQLPQYA